MSIKFEKSNIDEIMSKLISMRRISKDFHKKYVEPFMFTEELSGVRVTYLNKLDEVVRIFNFILVCGIRHQREDQTNFDKHFADMLHYL